MVQLSNDGSAVRAERSRRRAEAQRLNILRAAARVFRQRGFAGAGMREIAREADLSPGNLYHYFRGKHEILFFCQDRWLEHMLAVLDDAAASDAPVLAQTRAVLQAHVHYLLEELEGSAAHWEVEVLPEDLRRRIIEKRDRYERRLAALLRQGVASGEFVDCDLKLVTRAVLGALNWTARWFQPGGRMSAAAVAETLSSYLIRGLCTRPAALRSSPSPEEAEPDRPELRPRGHDGDPVQELLDFEPVDGPDARAARRRGHARDRRGARTQDLP